LLKTGAAAVAVAAAGAGGWSLSRAPRSARAPWRDAEGGGFGDVRLDALAYAILAPNPHNMQPWKIELDGDDALRVFCDQSRLLPQTDPPNRQITIGFGCFLELLRQAAAEKGYRAEIDYFPDGEPFPVLDQRAVAKVRFVSNAAKKDPLFEAALTRRTNRQPFKDKKVDAQTLQRILDANNADIVAGGAIEGKLIAGLRDLTVKAWEIEWATARTRAESINVMRIGKAEVNAAPFGLSLTGPLLDALGAIGALSREDMDIPGTESFDQSRDFYVRACQTAAGFVWSSSTANTRRDQLEAGRGWVRMQQAASLAGVGFHPLSQALQEFPEMAEQYQRAHRILAHEPGATVQMLARIGYADNPPPAPREPLASKIISD
jgi:hypothetical protein